MEATTAPPQAVDDSIFDATKYDLPIPEQDGHKAERLTLAVSGGVELDRTSEDDLEFLNGFKLGQEVELRITATVTKLGWNFSPGKDEAPPSASYGIGLRVHSAEVT